MPSTNSKGEDTSDLPDVKDELTFYQYKVGVAFKVKYMGLVLLDVLIDLWFCLLYLFCCCYCCSLTM